MYLLILFLPLLNFIILFGFGRYLKKQGAIQLTILNMGISVLVSLFGFFNLLAFDQKVVVYWLSRWFSIDLLVVNWGFIFDSLSLIMCVIVTFISFLVHVYSMDYMSHDPNFNKFLSYLSLFTFFMLLFVTGDNYVQMFFGWEGVGLASYLLINFWNTRLQANKSAIKAILVNRIGDFGFLCGVLLIYYVFKTVNFSAVFNLILEINDKTIFLFGFEFNVISLICAFLFIGVVGKSAQLILHTWLPDAMEGPTPVSALLHAATMVTAGIFLLVRSSALFEQSSTMLLVLITFGACTSFFGSFVGFFQNDLKKVIAYSTCSQLGYMLFACGVSNYAGSMLHLANHAFFKALLFLSAGAVIHALADEQDMRKMGGLLKLLPFTYVMMLTGSLSLMGIPYLTGYYSKDLLLEIASAKFELNTYALVWMGSISAFFTAFYSFRMLYLVFYSKPRFVESNIKGVHDAPSKMLFALFTLWIGTVFVGYFLQEWFIGNFSHFWNNSLMLNSFTPITAFEAEYIPLALTFLPLFLSLIGLLLGTIVESLIVRYFIARVFNGFGSWFVILKVGKMKWGFDDFYNSYVLNMLSWFGYHFSFKFTDRGLIELFGPLGGVRASQAISSGVSQLQTGKIYHYIFIMLIGILSIVSIVSFNLFNILDFDLSLGILFLFIIVKESYKYSKIKWS